MLEQRFCARFRLYHFFFPTIFFTFFFLFRRIICTIFLCNEKYRSPCSKRGKSHCTCCGFPLIENIPPCLRKKGWMFLHFQRFQHFRSVFFSFFATNFHLFFLTMPFQTPIFLACELSAEKAAIIFCCVLLCAVQDAQYNTEESP